MVFSAFIGSIIGFAITFPSVGFIFHPLQKKTVYGIEDFLKIGRAGEFEIGTPKKVIITASKTDGWNRFDNTVLGAAWIIKHSDENIVAMSTICPHLGCGIDWDGNKRLFICPCHVSVFDINGQVVSGPAPRPMDKLAIKIENNELSIRYRKLRLGIPKQVEV